MYVAFACMSLLELFAAETNWNPTKQFHIIRNTYANVRYQNEEIPIKSDTHKRTHVWGTAGGMRRRHQKRRRESIECHGIVCLFVSSYFRNFSSMRVLLVAYSNFVAPKHNNSKNFHQNASTSVWESTHARTHQRKILNWNYHINTPRGSDSLFGMLAMNASKRKKFLFLSKKQRKLCVHKTWKAIVACVCHAVSHV